MDGLNVHAHRVDRVRDLKEVMLGDVDHLGELRRRLRKGTQGHHKGVYNVVAGVGAEKAIKRQEG